MQDKRVLVAGCGKIGLRVAQALAKDFQVWGLRRSQINDTNEIRFISADLCQSNSLKAALSNALPSGIDYLIYCLSPNERSEEAYRQSYLIGLQNLLTTIPNIQRIKRVFFISSSSVYHQDDSSWVDEYSPCLPTQYSGKVILEAENYLTQSSLPSTVIRFSGIYGGDRRHLIRQIENSAEQGLTLLSEHERLSNRIHEDDCVGFITHLVMMADKQKELASLYLASDDMPIDLNEVILWLASTLNLEINTVKSRVAKRRGGNKKCANKRLKESGYALRFANYQEGYKNMLSQP